MAQALKRYTHRSPRFSVGNDERRIVRFAKVGDKSKSASTILIDISQSGMAFIVDRSEAPKEKDQIMVEFTVPGSQQMACYAEVARVQVRQSKEAPGEQEVVVAVRFCDLRNAHHKNLSAGLKQKFKELESMKKRERILESLDMAQEKSKMLFFWLLSAVALVITFYFVLQPRF